MAGSWQGELTAPRLRDKVTAPVEKALRAGGTVTKHKSKLVSSDGYQPHGQPSPNILLAREA